MNIKNQEKPVMRNIHLPCHGFFFYFIGNCDFWRDKKNKSLPNICQINSCMSMMIRRHGLEDIKTFYTHLVIK